MTHPKPAIAVDLALITVVDGKLRCLFMKRLDASNVGGDWALPGGFVHINEAIEQTASRVLREKVGMENAYLEQLFTYGAVNRDPRERVVSVTHFALIPAESLDGLALENDHLLLAELRHDYDGTDKRRTIAITDEHGKLSLAFDHATIISDVARRLRGKLDYTGIALELLPEFFTLRQAQEIYEAILGQKLTKPAFRRKLLDRKIIEPTGRREIGSAFRPAELYTRLNISGHRGTPGDADNGEPT